MLRSKKGFTLVELVITLLISTVVISITVALLLSAMNHYRRSVAMNEASEFTTLAYNFISARLTTAMGIEIGQNTATFPASVSVENGRLMYRRSAADAKQSIYDDALYGGGDLEITTEADGSYFNLTVRLVKDGELLFEKSSGFRLLNAYTVTGSGVLGTVAESENPVIHFIQGE